MIDYDTATIDNLFEELKKTKDFLISQKKEISNIYKQTKTRLNAKASAFLTYYYELHSLNKVITDSDQILNVIESITNNNVVKDTYVEQLKAIASKDRRQDTVNFKDEWLEEFENEEYSNIYNAVSELSGWIDDCVNIANGLKGFIEEKNPLINDSQIDNIPEGEVWITKDRHGYYLYDGNIIRINSPGSQYFKVFDIVFSLKPKGGDIKYSEIIHQGRIRKLTLDSGKILRAISGDSANLYHYVKDIPKSLSNGVPLFEPSSNGNFIKFNNKK